MNESTEYKMDATDKQLLDMLQEEFPLAESPFAVIGEKMGIPGDEIQNRIKALKAHGYIRRIGPVLDEKTGLLQPAVWGCS